MWNEPRVTFVMPPGPGEELVVVDDETCHRKNLVYDDVRKIYRAADDERVLFQIIQCPYVRYDHVKGPEYVFAYTDVLPESYADHDYGFVYSDVRPESYADHDPAYVERIFPTTAQHATNRSFLDGIVDRWRAERIAKIKAERAERIAEIEADSM